MPADDTRLDLYSGIDAQQPLAISKNQLNESVAGLEDVTHVYYCGKWV
jgi:hypothetical protein